MGVIVINAVNPELGITTASQMSYPALRSMGVLRLATKNPLPAEMLAEAINVATLVPELNEYTPALTVLPKAVEAKRDIRENLPPAGNRLLHIIKPTGSVEAPWLRFKSCEVNSCSSNA